MLTLTWWVSSRVQRGRPGFTAWFSIASLSSGRSVQKVSAAMTEYIIGFGAAERSRLAAGMPKRRIAVVSDENFHEGVKGRATDHSWGRVNGPHFAVEQQGAGG